MGTQTDTQILYVLSFLMSSGKIYFYIVIKLLASFTSVFTLLHVGFTGYKKKISPNKSHQLLHVVKEIIFIAMVTIMSGVAYLFRHCWEFFSAELAVLAAVLLTTLVLVHMKLIDVGWPLVAAVLIVILVIIIVHIQKTNETDQKRIPLEPEDSSENTETSVLKPHSPSRPEHPGNPLDPTPFIPEPAPISTEQPVPPAVPGPSTEYVEKDISFEPDVSEPEIEEVVEPPPVKYPGVPVAHSPDDAERVLTENGHNRRELETEYEGQVGGLLETVPAVSNECYWLLWVVTPADARPIN